MSWIQAKYDDHAFQAQSYRMGQQDSLSCEIWSKHWKIGPIGACHAHLLWSHRCPAWCQIPAPLTVLRRLDALTAAWIPCTQLKLLIQSQILNLNFEVEFEFEFETPHASDFGIQICTQKKQNQIETHATINDQIQKAQDMDWLSFCCARKSHAATLRNFEASTTRRRRCSWPCAKLKT